MSAISPPGPVSGAQSISSSTRVPCEDLRNFLESQQVHEALPESSKLLILDHKLTFAVALRALEQYKRPFACVLDPSSPSFSYLFDTSDIVAYFCHAHKYYTDRRYLASLQGALVSALQQIGSSADVLLSVESEADGGGIGQVTEEQRQQLLWDIDQALVNSPEPFSLQSLEATLFQGVNYSKFEHNSAKKSGSTRSDFGSGGNDDVTPSTATAGESEDCTRELGSPTGPGSTPEGNPENLRKSIEIIFPPPWDYNLQIWNRLNSRSAPFPHIELEQSLLSAAELLLSSGRSRVIVWDRERGTPFSFMSITSILGYVIQQLKSNCSVFDALVLKDLRLGTSPSDIVVVTKQTKFISVLELLRNHQWTAVPIVSHVDGSFIGLFSLSHVGYLLLRLLHDMELQSSWSFQDSIGKIWELLGSYGACHSKSTVHTYATFPANSPTPSPLSPDNAASHSGRAPSPLRSLANSPRGRPGITSKYGGTFMARIGQGKLADEDSPHPASNQGYHASGNPPIVPQSDSQDLPRLYGAENQIPGQGSPPSCATDAVQTLVRNITCSAAISDEDITLRQLIAHMVLTDDRRAIFIHPRTRKIRGYVTPSQLMSFLLGCSPLTAAVDATTAVTTVVEAGTMPTSSTISGGTVAGSGGGRSSSVGPGGAELPSSNAAGSNGGANEVSLRTS